jgi:hypothetical protein
VNTILTLLLFGSPESPPAWWDYLPRAFRDVVAAEATRASLYFPGEELWNFDEPEWFRGGVYIARLRFNGTPLPWPHDPVIGQRDKVGPYKPPR